MDKRTTVSDIIKVKDIHEWKQGDIITISAGTGSGKSHFIKNKLYSYARWKGQKILFLIHRRDCMNQFRKELERAGKTDTIHIRTYQYLENRGFDFSDYDYIVADEFHYFMNDASFNITTDISLKMILDQTDKVRIFMSGTGVTMTKYLCNHLKLEATKYDLDLKTDNINSLTFFFKDSTYDLIIKQAIEANQKTLFFFDKAEKAHELYERYKHISLFNCSKYNGKYYKHVDSDKIDAMLEGEKFDELLLFTTTTMDAGVNLLDLDLKTVVCEVLDAETLIQCIGRKRMLHEQDKIDLYVRALNGQELGGRITQAKARLERGKFFKEHSISEYIHKYYRKTDHVNMVYDVVGADGVSFTKELNELMYFKALIDKVELGFIKYDGYVGWLCDKLNRGIFSFYDEDIEAQDSLKDYLQSIEGARLYKAEQDELIDKIDLRVNGRQQKSFKKLNEGLDMLKLKYVIIPKKSGSTRYWIVNRMD